MTASDHTRFRLLNEFQRDFPVVPRPFRVLAGKLSVTEADVIGMLLQLKAENAIARVGGIVRPNTIGASTLAAMSIPSDSVPGVAEFLSGLPAVNHSYLREHVWNLWFVLTTPDEPSLVATLHHIVRQTGFRVLDLRLVQPFHIDLGFSLSGHAPKHVQNNRVDVSSLEESDRPLLQALCDGLPLVPEPYAALSLALKRPAEQIMARISTLCAAGIISRLGIIVRHRELGWASNAMVVWDIAPQAIVKAGEALAALPRISLCYQRRTEPDVWPYSLYAMIHARSRAEALDIISATAALPELHGAQCEILFSTHCFKQSGAWVHRKEAA
jgi:DNA-binding Lrp family transcriptional regulator